MSCEKYNNEKSDYRNKVSEYRTNLETLFKKNISDNILDFPKYVPSNTLKQFLARYELIKLIKDIPGDIIECGVCGGRGLFSLLQSHLILEPNFYYRKIIGFDTFEGFVSITDKDNPQCNTIGDFAFDNMHELEELGKLHTEFYYTNYNKVCLIKGDAVKTIPEYLSNNKHTIISLLYLDFDLYEPTKIALEVLLPRMPKGSIIAFDEIHFERFYGETLAMLESFDINKYFIKNILGTNINYIQL